jgi:hypothetical protein
MSEWAIDTTRLTWSDSALTEATSTLLVSISDILVGNQRENVLDDSADDIFGTRRSFFHDPPGAHVPSATVPL